MLHCVGGVLSWICAAVNRENSTMNTFVGGDDEVKTMKLVKEGFHHHKLLAHCEIQNWSFFILNMV